METFGNRYIKSDELSFHYSLFGVQDLEHNLDYIDSNGDRHIQELYAVDFEVLNFPHLRKSSFSYFPAYTGYNLEYDVFIGSISSDSPLVGTRRPNKSPHVRGELQKYLKNHLQSLEPEILHQDGHLILRLNNKQITDTTISVDTNSDGSLYFEMIVPTDNSLPTESRYDDAVFASEIWILLHDFAANLDTIVESTSGSLGRIAYSKTTGAQNLHIGIDRLQEANRTSLMLLTELDFYTHISSQASPSNGNILTIDNDVNFVKLDERMFTFTDDGLRTVLRRSITLAHSLGNGIINSNTIMRAATMERELGQLNPQPEA